MKKLHLSKETLVSLNQEEAHQVIGAVVVTTTIPTALLPLCNPTMLIGCTTRTTLTRVSYCGGCPTHLICPSGPVCL